MCNQLISPSELQIIAGQKNLFAKHAVSWKVYLHRKPCRWSPKWTLGGDRGECLDKLVDCYNGLSICMVSHEGNLPLIHIILPAAALHLGCMFLLVSSQNSFLHQRMPPGQPALPAAFCSHSATSLLFPSIDCILSGGRCAWSWTTNKQTKKGDSQQASICLPLLQELWCLQEPWYPDSPRLETAVYPSVQNRGRSNPGTSHMSQESKDFWKPWH